MDYSIEKILLKKLTSTVNGNSVLYVARDEMYESLYGWSMCLHNNVSEEYYVRR